MSIEQFKNIHAGETMLIVGNGENLKLTPPEWFDYPSFGVNTIHLYKGDWKPTYYTAVDHRLPREFGGEVIARFPDVPKFVPEKLRYWQDYPNADNFQFFNIRDGVLWSLNDTVNLWQDDFSVMTFGNIVHVAIKLCWYMGARRILIIGMVHKPANGRVHFWGDDTHDGEDHVPLADWFAGYKQLNSALQQRGVELLNISPETYVPDEIIPRADWREYAQLAPIQE